MRTNALALLPLLLLAACGGGGSTAPGAGRSTLAASADTAKLAAKLSEREIWSPGQILLEAQLLLRENAPAGIAAMDTYFHLNCSRVNCSVIKKGLR